MKKAAFLIVLLLTILIVASLPASAVPTPEYRALWLDGWHYGMWTQAQIDTMIDQAYNHGHYNVIIPQVRKKADALFVSHYGGPNGTGEPMVSQVSPSGFDPLAYMIQEAHARGMEVHPWLCTHRVASITTDWFYNTYNNWLTKDSAGALVNSEGWYLDPGVPDGEEYTVNYIMDLVKNYDIDGIQWDRVRYPTTNSGYNDIALARFKAEPNCNYTPSISDAKFSDFRRKQMNNFISRAYAQIMEVKPWVKVGANTFATYSDAYSARFQDWDAWMSNKWIDSNQPMNYTSDANGLFITRLTDALNRRYGRYVYTGFSLGSSGLAGGVTEINNVRSYNAGYGQPWGSQSYSYYYSYTGATTGWLDYVAAAGRPYNTTTTLPAPMPWKSSPTTGIILGRVTDAAQPNDPVYHNWVYKATITLSAPGLTRVVYTDATGYFVITEVDPKLVGSGYTITCSKTGFLSQTYTNQAIATGQVLRADFDLSTTSNLKTITAPAGTVSGEYSWISLPLDPVNANPVSVLPGIRLDGRLYRFNNLNQSQDMYDEYMPDYFGNLRTDEGYTLLVDAPYTISYTGYRGTPNRNISLPTTGSAFIGCPFEKEISWEDVMVTKGTAMVTMRTAKANNWLNSTAFWWDSATQSMHDIGLTEDYPSGTMMKPWHGYWLETYTDGLTLQLRQSAPD